MDERLKQALDFSNYLTTLNNQIRAEKEKFSSSVICYHNGGIFTIDRSLINHLHFLKDIQRQIPIILDDNDTPIEIQDLNAFYDEVIEKYFSALEKFNDGYKNLRRQRSVENLIK